MADESADHIAAAECRVHGDGAMPCGTAPSARL